MAKKHKCGFPGCQSMGKMNIQAYDVYLCKTHWDAYTDLALMPSRNKADSKKVLEARLLFWKACGSESDTFRSEFKKFKNGSHRLLRDSYTNANEKQYPDEWMKGIQKTLDKIKCGHIKVWPRVTISEKKEAEKTGKKLADEKYDRVQCEWCGSMIPSNGAAQFSHLRKHINELVKKGKLTELAAKSINSTKLSKVMRKLFERHFNEHR